MILSLIISLNTLKINKSVNFDFKVYITMEESQKRLSYIVPQVMKQYNIDKVIEVIKETSFFVDGGISGTTFEKCIKNDLLVTQVAKINILNYCS